MEAGKRYVDLAGGADRIVANAQQAYDKGDFRWAAEALKHVVYADAKNAGASELLARAFEQMGYAAESAPWRNVYLSGAFELRNGLPASGVNLNQLRDMLAHVPTERFLERMAASIDGTKAADHAHEGQPGVLRQRRELRAQHRRTA